MYENALSIPTSNTRLKTELRTTEASKENDNNSIGIYRNNVLYIFERLTYLKLITNIKKNKNTTPPLPPEANVHIVKSTQNTILTILNFLPLKIANLSSRFVNIP